MSSPVKDDDDQFFDAPDALEGMDGELKWFTITNLDTGEVIPLEKADIVIPPSPFLAGPAPPDPSPALSVVPVPSPQLRPQIQPQPETSGFRKLLDDLARLVGRGRSAPLPVPTSEQKPAGWVPVCAHSPPPYYYHLCRHDLPTHVFHIVPSHFIKWNRWNHTRNRGRN